MNTCFKAFKTKFPVAWSRNVPAAARPFLHEVTTAKAELAPPPPPLKVVSRTKMTSSSNEQDWYVCMHVREQRKRRPEVGSFWCVNISNPVYDSNNSRLRLERVRLPPSQLKRKKRGICYASEILIKNSVANTVHGFQYKSDYCDVLAIMGTKVYVMVGKNRADPEHFEARYGEQYCRKQESTSFQVYDILHGSWRTLADVPTSNRADVYKNFDYGHMIAVSERSPLMPKKSYVFDTIEEKWLVPAVALPSDLLCAVEFSGFLIGVENDEEIGIVAYKLDGDNGLPDLCSRHVLDDELWELFYPPLPPRNFVTINLHRFGDDKVVLVSDFEEHVNNEKFLVMAVFRVSVSTVSGIPVISAALEHKQVYNLANDCGEHYESWDVKSTFLMQNAPSCCTPVSNMEFEWDNQTLQEEEEDKLHGFHKWGCFSLQEETYEEEQIEKDEDKDKDNDDDSVAKKAYNVVEWDEQLKEKSLHMCFVENRTDSSVSYIVKAIKFSDLIGLNSKLHQTASTSGFHLPCLPSCGLFGSQILFAGGGNQGSLCEVEKIVDEPYTGEEYYQDVEVPQQAPINKTIYCYNVMSADQIFKRFPSSFKGMKPQPILAEVEGKLYALANSPMPKYMKNSGPCFEVFDPSKKQWLPLPDPPTYTKFRSSYNYDAIVGTNLLSWGGDCFPVGMRSRLSRGVFRFDMAAADRDWRLITNSHESLLGTYHGSSIAVDIGGGDFVFFGYNCNSIWHYNKENLDIEVHLISREFDDVVRLPNLVLPQNVTCLLRVQNAHAYSSFVHLGGQRVCLIVSSPFFGPYSRSLSQFGEVDKMSIVVLVFEFQVSEDRKFVDADMVSHQVLEYFDSDADARGNPKTSAAHMVGAFLV